jgi:hypothetical protein
MLQDGSALCGKQEARSSDYCIERFKTIPESLAAVNIDYFLNQPLRIMHVRIRLGVY